MQAGGVSLKWDISQLLFLFDPTQSLGDIEMLGVCPYYKCDHAYIYLWLSLFCVFFLLTDYYFFKHIRVRMEIIARNLWMLALLLMLTSTTSWGKLAINKLTLVIFIWIDFLAFTVPVQKRKSISWRLSMIIYKYCQIYMKDMFW